MKIYTAKKIYTVDNNFTSAQAMAINNGKIIELGNLTELSAKYPEAVIVSDYENDCLYPGFIEPHLHIS